METEFPSLARQMQAISKKQRREVMVAAAATLADYYQTDPEMQEWQALDAEELFDANDLSEE